ncbi:HNH endonuclease signature motif containing protein [Dietzia sp. ANT_WB102]|uniref:HNH endonuclease signature motif containing protein n=1 Tax=Dietzia sp. ANT_WB102 TaxID=2597345 RepID=UPI0011EE21F5|nr:HNH endonuclease signature motif containing protein [Dietzia sp. ANT_WB102]KAA0918681.1 DUF222 domain-containing protein [Dietzia sp. ANT_WB102]
MDTEHTEPSGDSASIAAASAVALEALYTQNRAAAARLRACHQLWATCRDAQELRDIAAGYGPGLHQRPEHAVIDPLDIASDQIVAVYGVHRTRARSLLTQAITLVTRFGALVEAMETGRLDEDTAILLARRMRTVDSLHRDDVQRDVLDWLLAAIAAGIRPGREAILSRTDRIIAAHDPAGVRLRRAAAVRERRIRLRRGLDGMADLHAHLTAAEATTIHAILHKAATKQQRHDTQTRLETTRQHGAESLDTEYIRSMDELRADALVAAFLDPTPGPGASRSPLATQIRPTITVLAPLGPDGEPEVYLPRGGPATIDALIELLSRSIGATVTVPDTHPGTADTPHGAPRYRPSAALAHRIRLRDGTCRHPGCSVPAEACDIDHVRPFDHTNPTAGGLTTEGNLMCLCRQHHRFKTFHGWRYHLNPDATLTVTTDTGHTITTNPDGPLARWRHHTTSSPDTDPNIPPPRRPWLNPHPHSTHWHRRAQRLAAERKANATPPPATNPDPDPPPF